MSDSTDPTHSSESPAPRHGGIKIRGGPHKIEAVKKSAEDAHTERLRFEKEQAETNTKGQTDNGDIVHPQAAKMRGGPNKIIGVQESAKKAQAAREQFAKEQEAATDQKPETEQ